MKVLYLFLFLFFVQVYYTISSPVLARKFKDTLAHPGYNFADNPVQCALCTVAVNEVEGMLNENLTASDIESLLKKDLCDVIPIGYKVDCDDAINELPALIKALESHRSVADICENVLSFCTHMVTMPDMVPLEEYTIDLDLPPRQRWNHIFSIPKYKQGVQKMVGWVESLAADHLVYANDLGNLILDYFPEEYAEEIRGGAEVLEVKSGLLAFANLGYELSDACTSIVAQNKQGQILHARNLDFGAGLFFSDVLRNITIQVHFQKGGKTLYSATTYVSYVGFLSAMKPGGFSITADTRFQKDGLFSMLYEIVRAITEKNYQLVSFLIRDTFEQQNDWNGAVKQLSSTPLLVDVYLITAGTKPGEGAIISRNQTGSRNTWKLDAPTRWFEVETNYDHWESAPWFDDRRHYANKGMSAMTESDVTLDKMLSVLSTRPVLNRLTTYSILMNPASGEYKGWTRFCKAPCPT